MTAADIQAQYESVIGADATAALAAAGLLPTVEEEQWVLDTTTRVTTATRDSMTYIKQSRLTTAWTDRPAS